MLLPHRWLKILLSIGSFIILLMGFQVWQIKQEFFVQPASNTKKLITIPKGSSARKLSYILQDNAVIRSPHVFLALLKYYDFSHHLKSGTYLLNPHDTVWSLVEKMERGQVYQINIQIIEGTRLCDLVKKLSESKDYQFTPSMLNELQNNYASLEGLLFPSTYMQAYGESVLPVLKLAQKTMQEKLTEIWSGRDYQLPYQSEYELLVAASIIEKETAIEEERRLISGVIVNRLKLGMPLQMDPTVAYGLPGCEHVVLKGKDIKVDSAYNTYRHRGLPPTPIAMVSRSSLMAAAHPHQTAFLYFVAKGDGSHLFSVEYEQQKKAIQQYLRVTNAN